MRNPRTHLFPVLMIFLGLLLVPLSFQGAARASTAAAPSPSPSPTYDPLATPALPANPSEYDLGKYQYYFDCMPCHGDVGQGLTDEFRMVWEEDHRNCWARGCHTGRVGDEGFPIPTIIPAIIATNDQLKQFTNFAALQQYLHDTHPPQYPGKLSDAQYRNLTVFLWDENHKPTLTPTPLPSMTLTDTPTRSPTATPTTTPSPLPSPTVIAAETHLAQTAVTPSAQPTSAALSSSSLPPGLVIAALALLVLVCIILAYSISRSNTTKP